MSTAESGSRVEDPKGIKDDWLGRLESLIQEVSAWARKDGWRVRKIAKTVEERALGAYQVPVLLMEKDTVEVVLNPVARFVPESEGAVDLYLSPAYDDIASLYVEEDRWVVYDHRPHEASPDEPKAGVRPSPYNEATIRAILGRMAADA